MQIAGFIKNSFVDFPGKIASVIFLPGCNFDCFYCHNRHIISGNTDNISFAEVDAFFQKRKDDIEGVVVSGGEPTLHKQLSGLLSYIKDMGYATKLDTNGSNPEVIRDLLQKDLLDFVAVDYKAPKKIYTDFAGEGADAELVLSVIDMLLASKVPFEVRTTLAPGLDEQKLLEMASQLPPLPRYVLNAYRKPQSYPVCYKDKINETALTREQIRAVAEEMKAFQPNIIV